jgi:hypothetical protein
MKNIFTPLIFIALFISCQSNDKKENDVVKEETALSNNNKSLINDTPLSKDQTLTEDIKSLFTILNNELMTSQFDSQGNFSIDMGAASTGRVKGNLKKVDLRIEFLPERPGCADVCPEMAVIYFKCKYGVKCIEDPNVPQFDKHNEGAISFQGLDTGLKVFQLLGRVQKSL